MPRPAFRRRGEVWAEPSLLARLEAGVGDEIEVGTLQLRVTQTLEFRPDEGWRFMEIAPTVLLEHRRRLAVGLARAGQHRRATTGCSPATRLRLAAFRAEVEPELGPATRCGIIRDGRPEVRAAVGNAERFLGLAALVSVLLGGVAVAMAARRFVARRLDAVALMKCLGARHRDVLRLNLLQLLMLVRRRGRDRVACSVSSRSSGSPRCSPISSRRSCRAERSRAPCSGP